MGRKKKQRRFTLEDKYQIIKSHIVFGKNFSEIAKEFGCATSTISRIISNSDKQPLLKEKKEEILAQVKRNTKKDVKKAFELMKGNEADEIVQTFMREINNRGRIVELAEEDFPALIRAFKDFAQVRFKVYEIDKRAEMHEQSLENQNNLYNAVSETISSGNGINIKDIIDPESLPAGGKHVS